MCVCVCVMSLLPPQDLEVRLSRYQVKSDTLKLKNTDLQKKLEQQLEDQDQIVSFLKRKAQEQIEAFVDLEERLLHAQQVKEKEKKELEVQVAQLKEESQRAINQATMENSALQSQLDSLEAFRQNKDRIEQEMVEKQEEVEKLKAEHVETIYRLEKSAVLDKDRCTIAHGCIVSKLFFKILIIFFLWVDYYSL